MVARVALIALAQCRETLARRSSDYDVATPFRSGSRQIGDLNMIAYVPSIGFCSGLLRFDGAYNTEALGRERSTKEPSTGKEVDYSWSFVP